MNIDMNGKKIAKVIFSNGEQITADEFISITLSATYHGDRDEFWVIVSKGGTETERHNTNAESRYWCNQYKIKCRELEGSLSEANAILHNPKAWMQWCDNRMLERNEQLQAENARLREDAERLNFLEKDESRTAENGKYYHALFRRNMPITREAIDAARKVRL